MTRDRVASIRRRIAEARGRLYELRLLAEYAPDLRDALAPAMQRERDTIDRLHSYLAEAGRRD